MISLAVSPLVTVRHSSPAKSSGAFLAAWMRLPSPTPAIPIATRECGRWPGVPPRSHTPGLNPRRHHLQGGRPDPGQAMDSSPPWPRPIVREASWPGLAQPGPPGDDPGYPWHSFEPICSITWQPSPADRRHRLPSSARSAACGAPAEQVGCCTWLGGFHAYRHTAVTMQWVPLTRPTSRPSVS